MSSSGSCLCSQVKYTFTGQPTTQAICHCLSCRKVSGSAFTTNLLIPTPAFGIVSGTNSVKSFAAKHESGMTLSVYFCENCGTTLYKEGDMDAFKGVTIVQAGTLDGHQMKLGDVHLEAELYVKHRVEWVGEKEGVAQCQEFA